MNRILKRPMFRIGGSAGTGITSGLDRTGYAGRKPTFKEYLAGLSKEQKQMQQENLFRDYQDFLKRQQVAEQKTMAADGGRIGYQQGSMPNFQLGGLPGFATSLGLNLLATPPQGNIFQTIGTAAKDPFNMLQAQQTAALKTASDRAFARKLAGEEREFEEKQLEKKLAAQRDIAAMDTGNLDKRLEKAREDFGDDIKAARAIEFADTKFKQLENRFGEGQVATTVIDSDNYQRKGSLEKFVKQNPRVAGLKIYDVATNKPVIIVTDKQTGRLTLVPADSADIDTTGETQPAPSGSPGLFNRPTKPGRDLKDILPDFRDTGFDEDFYQ